MHCWVSYDTHLPASHAGHFCCSGAPVVLCCGDRLKTEVFEDLPLAKRQSVCLSLCHCLNWFRELVYKAQYACCGLSRVHVNAVGVCICWRGRRGHEREVDHAPEGHHWPTDPAGGLHGRWGTLTVY